MVYPLSHDPVASKLCSDLLRYRDEALAKEEAQLSPFAARSGAHERKIDAELDHRLPYKRDVDRIVHSKAYARYIDKTQVVYLIANDHVTHRSLHVQLVSNYARGIAEILGLNLGLVEAIALGHDVGHCPFGHEGERHLDKIAKAHGLPGFAHPWQSCRLFTEIEPLNLGLAVYDGFLCHDGGLKSAHLAPAAPKNWQQHADEMQTKISDANAQLMPFTLEGCLVKICDTISYVARDIEDAIILGLIKREEVLDTELGKTSREILGHLAQDIISTSFGKPYIAMSETGFKTLKALRAYNFQHIYFHPKIKTEAHKIYSSLSTVFSLLLDDLEKNGASSLIHKEFICNKRAAYKDKTAPAQFVLDYIAGMTDHFFISLLERLTVPQPIRLT